MKTKNPTAYFTRAEVEFLGKPFFTGKRWIGFKDENERLLLTRSRCEKLGQPVADDEDTAAYRYTVEGPSERKYVPVYDRTNCPIPKEKLYPKEIYPLKNSREN